MEELILVEIVKLAVQKWKLAGFPPEIGKFIDHAIKEMRGSLGLE